MRKKKFLDSMTLGSLLMVEIVKFIFSLTIGFLAKKVYNAYQNWKSKKV